MSAAIGHLATAWRIALRELRGGAAGFRIFLVCLSLGVGAIAAVGSFSQSVISGLIDNGQALLGGDLELHQHGYPISAQARRFLTRRGELSEIATMRTMARAGSGDTVRRLVEIKAIDDLYPLYGALTFEPGTDLRAALAQRRGRHGALVEKALLESRGLSIGDPVQIGDITLEVRGVIGIEPDRSAAGFAIGPRIMISKPALNASGLVQLGSLVHWRYRLKLGGGSAGNSEIAQVVGALDAAFPDAGWTVRTRANAAPGLKRFVDRLTLFLTLLSFAALIVGGVGIGNGVKAYLDRKTATIATLKCIGAGGGLIFLAYLFQILILAGAGILAGLVFGALVPGVVAMALSGVLPVDAQFGLYPVPLAVAALLGIVVAVIFALWPLGRARDTRPAALFRDAVDGRRMWPRRGYLAGIAAGVAVLLGLMLVNLDDRVIVFAYAAGLLAAIALLFVLAHGLSWAARRAPPLRGTARRMALASLHRPGNLVASFVVSLGIGLALIVALALVDSNINQELKRTIAEDAPSFFFVDIQRDQLARFEATARAVPGVRKIQNVPMLRGRIVRINGVAPDAASLPHNVAWVLRGDRGITYSATVPANSRLTTGTWWSADYDGPPLVSLTEDIAAGLNVTLGDTLTVNVLGRPVVAKIANLRTVNWGSLSINFVLVFSPNTFTGAPHMFLATASVDEADEPALQRAISAGFANVTAVSVRQAVKTVADLAGGLLMSLRAASGIALVAAALVLAGTMAAGYRARLYDAAILKTLGAERKVLIRAYALEFLVLGTASALFAVVAGTAAAYGVTIAVLKFPWAFDPAAAGLALLLALPVSVGVGLLGTWRILGRRPAPLLRARE